VQAYVQGQRFSTTNMNQMMGSTFWYRWVVMSAMPHSGWRKYSSPSSNLPIGQGSPTVGHSTSAIKYRWLGFRKWCNSQSSRERNLPRYCNVEFCTRIQRLKILLTLSRTGYLWKSSLMPIGFGGSGLRCFKLNVQGRFVIEEIRDGEVRSD